MSIDRDRIVRDAHEAASLKDNQFLNAVLSQVESDALELAIAAPITDDATRAAAMAEIRAARSIISKLNLRIAEATALGKTRAGVA